MDCYQGSHPTWNFVIFFSRPGKYLEFAPKVVKTWKKNLKFANYVLSFAFQDIIYKNNSDFNTSLSYLHYQHKHWFKAKLTLDFITFTWKIHGIMCHKRSGNPASVLAHFKIFITKICMKVPGIWHKKTLEFRTKNLEFVSWKKRWVHCRCG